MKKSILLGLGACALALGGVASLIGQKAAAEAKADDPKYVYVDIHDCIWRKSWTASISGGNIKVHFFNDGGPITAWPGNLPTTTVDVGGVTFGKWSVPEGATKMIVTAWDAKSDGVEVDKNKTATLNIPDSEVNTFRVNTENDGSLQNGTWTAAFSADSSTVKLYDVDNRYSSDPRTQMIGTLSYGFPGAEMDVEKALYDGRVLSHTYYNVFGNYDRVQFTNAGDYQVDDKSGDQTIQSGKIYVMRSNKTGGWYSQSAAEAAAAFVYDNMKISAYHKGYARGDDEGDGSCKTYYWPAKTAYGELDEEELNCVKTIWPEALDRLEDWAAANGDVFDKNAGFSSSGIVLAMHDDSNTSFIVAVSAIGIISALTIGGAFVARKRRAE